MKKTTRRWILAIVLALLIGLPSLALYGIYRYQKAYPEMAVYTLAYLFNQRSEGVRESPFVQDKLRDYMHHLMATSEPWPVTVYKGSGNRPDYLVVVVGDSLTAGRRVEEHQRYAYFLEKLIAYHMPGKRVVMVNAGKPGNTVRGVLRRLDRDVISLDPDLVVFGLGFNDSRILSEIKGKPINVLPLEDHLDDYDRVISTIQKKTKAKILLFSPAPVSPQFKSELGPKYTQRQVKVFAQYAKTAKKMADKYGCGYADVYRLIKTQPSGQKLFLHDGLHPNPKGNLLMAEKLFESWCTLEGIDPKDQFDALVPKAIGKVDLKVNPFKTGKKGKKQKP